MELVLPGLSARPFSLFAPLASLYRSSPSQDSPLPHAPRGISLASLPPSSGPGRDLDFPIGRAEPPAQ